MNQFISYSDIQRSEKISENVSVLYFYSLSHHLLHFINYLIRIKSLLCDIPTLTQLFSCYYCYLLSRTGSFLYSDTVFILNYNCSLLTNYISFFIVVVGDANIEELRKHAGISAIYAYISSYMCKYHLIYVRINICC